MPPKKKGNKKAQDDDWEAELGETIAPQDAAPAEGKTEDAAPEDDALGGGLMAALQRRGKKKNKKGADFELEGEDPPANDANGDLESKAPQEGNFDDEDEDVFAGNYGKKKNKGGAAAPAAKTEEAPEENDDGAPRVKTKAEKEKEKKEKEKQRKKELVRSDMPFSCHLHVYCGTDTSFLGREKEGLRTCESRIRENCRVQG